MVAFNFPASPTEGQVFAPAGGPQYVYRAPYWRASGRVDTIVAETPPVGPKPGQLWFNSATGNTYIWYEDPNSAQWVQINVGPDAAHLPTPVDYGARLDGVTDDTAAYQALLASGAKTIDLGSGVAKITEQLNFPVNTTFIGGAITLDFMSAIYSAGDFPNNACVYVKGADRVSLPALSVSPVKGASSLTFASPPTGLVPGSIIAVYNPTDGSFNAVDLVGRAYYRAGEYAEVRSVSGSTVTLKRGLIDGYNHTVVTMHKFSDDKVTFNVGRLTVNAPTTVKYGVWLSLLRDSTHDRITVNGAGEAALTRDQCYNISGNDLILNQDFTSGGDYGLVDGNCQITRATGIFTAKRHGYAGGGGGTGLTLPCRFMDISGVFTSLDTTDTSITICAANAHGNCEHYKFSGVFHGGINAGGDFGTFRGEIYVEGYNQTAICATENVGSSFDCDGVRVFAEGDNTGTFTRGILDIGGNGGGLTAATRRGGTWKFTNMVIDAPTSTRWLLAVNRGFTHATDKIGISVAGTELRRGVAGIRVTGGTGDLWDFLDLRGFKNLPGTAYSIADVSKIKGFQASGRADVTTVIGQNAAAVTIPLVSPRAPNVSVRVHNADALVGSDVVRTIAESITPAQFVARIRANPGINYSAVATLTLQWVATLDEY